MPSLYHKHATCASLFSPRLLLVDMSIWATSPLGVAVRHIFCSFFFFSPNSGYVTLWDSKTPHIPAGERVSWCLETSPPSWLPPWDGSLSLTLLSLFLSFIFCPTSFWRDWSAFLGAWCPCQRSEVVLCKLLSIQMIFWWKWSPLAYSSAIILFF